MKYFLRLAFYSEKQFGRKTGYLFYSPPPLYYIWVCQIWIKLTKYAKIGLKITDLKQFSISRNTTLSQISEVFRKTKLL